MKSWPETVLFSLPLREATLAARSWDGELERRIQERERAAMERGRAEAQKLFSQQMVSQRAELVALQQGILGAIKDAAPQVMKACEEHLVELALDIARKVIDATPVQAEAIRDNIVNAMRQVEESATYTVLVNPQDLLMLESAAASLPRSDESHRVTMVASNEVTRGGCIVETPFGRVDARRETKFELLKGALLN
jgi:flagellar assembly protein FliH